MTTWESVWVEHQSNVGFVEGPNNQNPWTEELGINDTQYCDAAASLIPHHNGVTWWDDCQFGRNGSAYCPYHVSAAQRHGCWMDDHASVGHPCDLRPGDLVFFSWDNNGVADHVETAVAIYEDGTYDTVGYNTGSPEGCHYPIRRDRKYLLGRLRMEGTFYSPDAVPPVGGNVSEGYPFNATSAHIADWTVVDGHSWILDGNGAVYAAPGTPGVRGVNGADYFVGRTPAKLHVRAEDGVYVSTIEATSGELYRPSGGTPFKTH